MTSTDKAALFRSLHSTGDVLVLPNAWDAASARIIEQAGAKAVATTSAGVAWSLGRPDGDRLDREQAVAAVARIAAAVDVPVSADIETGFGADADGVAETIRQVIAAGAVGVNIEDSVGGELRDVTEQAERYAAARAAADETGVALFVNARIDTYLLSVGDPATRLDHTLARAEAFVAAGVDGVFVPGAADRDTLAALVAGVSAPLHALAWAGAPSVATMRALGVAKVTVGARIALAAYSLAARAATEMLTDGTYETTSSTLSHHDLDTLLAN